jgi:hypothetical protein
MNNTTAHENGDENNNTMQYEEPNMSIQPITINKHHIHFNLIPHQNTQNVSLLSNLKQIIICNETKLQLFFNPYYKKQFYSLSGYFHISSALSFEDIKTHKDMTGWLEENRYYIKMYPSQNKEMVQIGALCFSSTQDAEFYRYFVPIFNRWTDRRTDGQTLNPCWSGVTTALGFLYPSTSWLILPYPIRCCSWSKIQ